MKTCSRCHRVKSTDDFGKDKNRKDGLNPWCRECVKRTSKAYYRANIKQRRSASLQIYHRNAQDDEFRDRRNARKRVYSKDYIRRPRTRRLARKWTQKYLSRIETRISRRLSFQVWYSLRLVLDQSQKKNGRHWQDLVGWSVEQLMTHLASKFQPGMTWQNYGGDVGWQIDHVVPKSWFKIQAIGDEAFQRCWALDNLQPRWLKDNASKGARFSG